jgi:hypothetical protein
LHSATSSTATKFEALEGLPLKEELVLDLLEGVLSVGKEEPLFFSLLLMLSGVELIDTGKKQSNGNGAGATINQSQWRRGNGNGGTMAPGQRQWQWQ